MSNILVTYFSASGVTKTIAQKIFDNGMKSSDKNNEWIGE